MQTSSEKHLHYPKILPPSNKTPDAGRQKSMNFVATECPDDTSKEVGDEVGLQRGGRGPPVKHEQTKKHQKNLEILLLQYIYVNDALLTPSKFETLFAPNSGFPNLFLKEVDEEEAMEGQNEGQRLAINPKA